MGRVLLALVAGSAMLLAGCLGATNPTPAGLPAVGDLLRPATEALWHNPQTTPHPMFNFPTLSNPAVGGAVPTWWQPIPAAELPSPITGLELLAATTEQVPSSGGMSVFGSLAVLPGVGNPTSIVDIRDPANPKLLSTIEEEGSHRNVDFIAYPDGRLVAVFATGNGTIPVWDITDPTRPVRLSGFQPSHSTHKINVVPGTPIVYNANSNGGGCSVEPLELVPGVGGLACFFVGTRAPSDGQGVTEIYDLTDPANPVLVQDWANGFGCHHIYFWLNPADAKYRAVCAGIQMTQIWDIADPRNPTVIVNVPMQHGNDDLPGTHLGIASFSHFSILNYAGDVLIVGDESNGGVFPPGCLAHASTPAGDAATPLGAIWFYDVSTETDPQLMGWFSPGHPVAMNPPTPDPFDAVFYSCTAHHGRLVPDPSGRELLAMAFYRAGTVLVDFTDPRAPHEVAQFIGEGGNTWEVQYYNGYLFTGDTNRGMDVLSLT